jgi:ubiquinone/menaquinone biosynthesis C-methylase UbiE
VFELGCGTGRVARALLAERLPSEAEYAGVDLSPEMVRLARERLAPFAERARVRLTDGSLPLPEPDGWADRFLSTYVLDLLSGDEIRAVLSEARRVLRPGGLLCLVSLTRGVNPLSRAVVTVWGALHALSPRLVGGCRPLDLEDFVREQDGWKTRHRERLAAFGVPSEVLVAERA